MSDHDDDTDYALVMPFVICTSAGGPFDDRAFVAGWECGAIDQALTAVRGYGATINRWVKPELVPQLDLIAMKHELALTVGDTDPASGYVAVEFALARDEGGA